MKADTVAFVLPYAIIVVLFSALLHRDTQLTDTQYENAGLRGTVEGLQKVINACNEREAKRSIEFTTNHVRDGKRTIIIDRNTFVDRAWNRSDNTSGVTHSTVSEPCDFDKNGKLIENHKCHYQR